MINFLLMMCVKPRHVISVSFAALAVISSTLPGQAFAEKIYCKDGRVLAEKISYRNRGTVWYKKSSGSIGINIKDIDRIESDDGSVSKYDYKNMGKAIQDMIKEEKYNGAIIACTALLQTIPDNAQIRYLRGMLSQKIGNEEMATEDYSFLVKNKLADAAILNNLGTIYASDQKYKQAMDLFIRASAENSDMVEPHDNMASTLMQTKSYDLAIEEYQKVLAKEPDNINVLYNLGILYMSKKEYDKAKDVWAKALSLKPEDEDTKKALQYLPAR
jgi:tetratricopeptide (TPR) repeat protein